MTLFSKVQKIKDTTYKRTISFNSPLFGPNSDIDIKNAD